MSSIEIPNALRERLATGGLALGIGLRQARTVDIGRIMKTCGYDWLFVDCEHNSMDLDTAVQICVAAQDAGITPLVRVAGFEHHLATRALDGGAQGIVVPHVDDAETAARMVSQCRYPPDGHRSIYGTLPQVGFESHPPAPLAHAINAATLVIVMIETPTAVDNVDAIAAVPGVDGLLVGGSDLSLEMGIPGELDHPRMVDAIERVVAACERHGRIPGLGGVYTSPLVERYVDAGMRMLLCGSDLSMMMSAASARASHLRGLRS